jgi:hypothetical protein
MMLKTRKNTSDSQLQVCNWRGHADACANEGWREGAGHADACANEGWRHRSLRLAVKRALGHLSPRRPPMPWHGTDSLYSLPLDLMDDGNVETRRYWVNAAFRRTLQREPDEAEMDACLRLLERRSLAELCRVLLNVNEFVFVD